MISRLDKCYHVVCAIPVVQTFVGGAFAAKDILGIIKDIAIRCLFPNYETNVNNKIQRLQKTTKALDWMENQRKTFVKAAISGDAEAKKIAVKGMLDLQKSLRAMELLFPSEFIKKPNSTDYLDVDSNTNVYIHQAVIHCRQQTTSLNLSLYLFEAVPARTRLYNLATNIISMIPTYNIGTVYNLGVLAYYTFIKKN